MRDPLQAALRRRELEMAAAQSAVDILATCVTSKRFKARDNEVARDRAARALVEATRRYREAWEKSRISPAISPAISPGTSGNLR